MPGKTGGGQVLSITAEGKATRARMWRVYGGGACGDPSEVGSMTGSCGYSPIFCASSVRSPFAPLSGRVRSLSHPYCGSKISWIYIIHNKENEMKLSEGVEAANPLRPRFWRSWRRGEPCPPAHLPNITGFRRAIS